MLISEATKDALNELVRMTFQMNGYADNTAYSLDIDFNCPKAEPIYHHKYAHIFGVWADEISTKMSHLGARPIRRALDSSEKIYNNLYDLFKDNCNKMMEYRQCVLNTRKIAVENNDTEIVIFLETFWDSKSTFVKQVYIWMNKAKEYVDKFDIESFDRDFDDFTII